MKPASQTFAGIDVGTNSVRLLIRDREGRELERMMQITRLGQGVDATGRLHPEAVERTLRVLEGYGTACQRHGVVRLRAVATSAARDAANRDDFFGPAAKLLGQELELLSGQAEASLSFTGATRDLGRELAPFVVIDIGGGSTEFARGVEVPSESISLDVGSVRLTEKFVKGDPPRAEELSLARRFVVSMLERVADAVRVSEVGTWLGVAGTVTSVAALVLGLERYEPEVTHGFCLSREQVRAAFERLAAARVEQRRRLLAEPKRAEVIVMGALLLDAIMERFSLRELRVSERDILDGLAASAVEAVEQADAAAAVEG